MTRRIVHWTLVIAGSLALTFAFFMVLPLIQAITRERRDDTVIRAVDTAFIPPPPLIEEEPPPEEEEPEEEPPELEEEAPLMDLSQMELALNTGIGGGWLAGDFAVDISRVTGGGNEMDELFSLSDLDQRPRVLHQPSPQHNPKTRRRAPGKVQVIFIVNEFGRVENPKVRASTDPVFEGPALAAVKQWRFEPGKRKGNAVRFRMLVPITFPEEES